MDTIETDSRSSSAARERSSMGEIEYRFKPSIVHAKRPEFKTRSNGRVYMKNSFGQWERVTRSK